MSALTMSPMERIAMEVKVCPYFRSPSAVEAAPVMSELAKRVLAAKQERFATLQRRAREKQCR